MLLRYSLLVTCALAAVSCHSRPAGRGEIEREVEFVAGAFSVAAASEVALDGPEPGFLALTWTFRLRTTQSAPLFYDAVTTSLAQRYRCQREPNRVWCSRTLSGDLIQLEIMAVPGAGETTARATLKAMAN